MGLAKVVNQMLDIIICVLSFTKRESKKKKSMKNNE